MHIDVNLAAARRQRNYRDIEDDLEDSLSQLPAHLQKRKEVIDIANKTLDERAALKLAPDYDEVEFSDEERLVLYPLLNPADRTVCISY